MVKLRTNAWRLVLIGGLVTIVAYFAYPDITSQNIIYSLLGKAAVGFIVVGIVLHRPKERLGWIFYAAAIACFSVGDDITTYYQVFDHSIPFPSVADAAYLAGYPFLFAGVLRLTRNPQHPYFKEDNADAAIIALGALAVSWQFLMTSYVHDVTLSTFGMLVNVAYPMMDIALIFIIFRALVLGQARYFFQRLLAAAIVIIFTGDFIFDLLSLHNSYSTGNFVDGFFLLQYTLVAAAALHPSTADKDIEIETSVGALKPTEVGRSPHVPVMILGGFVPPTILVVASALHQSVDVLPLSLLCVAVFTLVGLRLRWLIGRMGVQATQINDSLTEMASLEERSRLAFEDNMAPMLFANLDDKLIAANDAFCAMIGYSREELLGSDSALVTHPEDVGISESSNDLVLSGGADQSRYVKRYVRKDGRVITVEVLRSLARDAQGKALYFIISERDMTDEMTLSDELSHRALHDSLTGLANRALFLDRLEQVHAKVVRQGGLCAVLLLDLDEFKGVNDSLGHVVGDQLLVAVARRLESVTRASDTLCRFGGDEFLYLAETVSGSADAERAAERLLDALSRPFTIEGHRIEQRASIGIVVSDVDRADQSEYIQDADVALYEAKREGKGHYVVFTSLMHQQVANRFTLTQELRHASRTDQLSMYFQPIVELATSRIVGFEALMRWRHPERGMILPGVFIPIAEQSELILELGYFALERSIAEAATWIADEAALARPYVTVNLSARQFHDPRLVSVVDDLLTRAGLAPQNLVIEITESVTLQNLAETMIVVDQLNRLGVALALDDFGTGFSSLSYLATLHPMIIKIDQTFLSHTSIERRSDTLLEAIVSLGHQLNVTMLAEGVETQDQLRHLREMNCELGQGFLWSPAVPAEEVNALLHGATVHSPSV
jgi:diguanylate cyclase (GGDEF)-like protein/PAS domain S-box-containing protein